ncbi:MAG: hypothetical protein LBH58_04560 [Tannerellaceae bacterium]|nr:hypothetical protein [Tannerellaceae bacterium]
MLAVFEVRLQDLIVLCDKQTKKIEELTISLELRGQELEQAEQTIGELKARCDNMLTARIISVKEKEVKSAKMRLSKLVREVDKCIALLNE